MANTNPMILNIVSSGEVDKKYVKFVVYLVTKLNIFLVIVHNTHITIMISNIINDTNMM